MKSQNVPLVLLWVSLVGFVYAGADLFFPPMKLISARLNSGPSGFVTTAEYAELAHVAILETRIASLMFGGIFLIQLIAVAWITFAKKPSSN